MDVSLLKKINNDIKTENVSLRFINQKYCLTFLGKKINKRKFIFIVNIMLILKLRNLYYYY